MWLLSCYAQLLTKYLLLQTLSVLLLCSHIDSISGFWKSSAEPTHAFSFSGLQRTQELYHSNSNSMFSSPLNVGFSLKNERSTPTNNHLYWPVRDMRTESYSAIINKPPPERKQESVTAGCRLFGIEISNAASPVVTAASVGQDQPPAVSVDVESDQLSQPSHANKTDATAASSERSPHDTESRQVRSCTKVITGYYLFDLFLDGDASVISYFVCAGNHARNGSWQGSGLDEARWV
jgi:auxin response factor